MLFLAVPLLALLSFSHIIDAVSTSQLCVRLKSFVLTFFRAKTPTPPSADPFTLGLQTGTLDCNHTAVPLEKPVVNDILQRFCTDHQGVNLAQGDNFSTFYDADNKTRLYFNVINQCQPTVYLLRDICLSGFTRIAKCSTDRGFEWTAGGQAAIDCMAFDIASVSNTANAAPVLGYQGNGVVVTCEGLCESK